MENKKNIKNILEKLFFAIIKIFGFLIDNKIYRTVKIIFLRAYWKTKLNYIGENTVLYPSIVFHNPEKISIGKNCSVAEFVHFWGGSGVKIGNNVMIASHAVITSSTHKPEELIMRNSTQTKPITIEDNVWIGAHAIILPGIVIKEGSVVAAGAVVNKDVPENVIVAGIPAKKIRDIKRESGEYDKSKNKV